RFSTRNQFYGGQIGTRAEVCRGPMFVDFSGKVAFGSTHQVVSIDGNTSLIESGVVTGTVPGGALALRTNIGRTAHDHFTVVPEVGVQVGCQVTDHVSLFVGYNFLYWSSVVRPGDQINRTVNANNLPSSLAFNQLGGPAEPSPLFHR